MPNDYVEDYEQVTGKVRVVETKVIDGPAQPEQEPGPVEVETA